MSSSRALFDEESSDEDDAPVQSKVKQERPEEPEQPKKQSNTAALFGDDDDDSDEDGDDNAVAAASQASTNTKQEPVNLPPKKKPTTSELFGDDSDDDDEGEAKLDDIVGEAAPVNKEPAATPMDQDEPVQMLTASTKGGTAVAKPPASVTVLESTRPNNQVSLHMTKLPNLVAIQPEPFDEDNYLPDDEEVQYKGYVHNMIRWRYKKDKDGQLIRSDDGSLTRESNTRLVQWSDGSFTLHIGNEAFDIQTVDSSSKGFAGLNGYVHLSQKATLSNDDEEGEGAPGGTVLESIGAVTSRLVAKPSSLQSEAHKSLTVAVRQRTIKTARIAEYVTQEDPEKAKAARIRNKEDLEKATARKSSSYRPSTSRHRSPGMNRRYLEEEDDDDDYDTTNIRKLKKGAAMEDDMDDYGDESDDDENETFRTSRDRKRRKQEDSDEDELVFDEDSDDEEGTLITAHKKSKRSHQAVVDDDDDDD
eukprot:Nitzschia sp. Nitz4//scaffold170_size48074//41907//43334//NITZ4_007113-RA/size48074-processed-gene-0.15-mRNA-1//1//CDS//3329538664//3312//frame0